MFKGWRAIRWETPVSNLKSIAMVSLIDNGSLTIVLEDLQGERKRWSFSFESAPAYFNLMEEFRGEMWSEINWSKDGLGRTLKFPSSMWLQKLKESDDLIEVLKPNLEHYQIVTEDDVIDILSEEEPQIKELEPSDENDPVPGKSTIYYRNEDFESTEEFLETMDKLIHKEKTPNKGS